MASVFFARGRKTSLTFLKNKIFTSGQKHRERIGTAVPKHRKTSKTDQNSKSYPKKTEGWALNSGTQFMIIFKGEKGYERAAGANFLGYMTIFKGK